MRISWVGAALEPGLTRFCTFCCAQLQEKLPSTQHTISMALTSTILYNNTYLIRLVYMRMHMHGRADVLLVVPSDTLVPPARPLASLVVWLTDGSSLSQIPNERSVSVVFISRQGSMEKTSILSNPFNPNDHRMYKQIYTRVTEMCSSHFHKCREKTRLRLSFLSMIVCVCVFGCKCKCLAH